MIHPWIIEIAGAHTSTLETQATFWLIMLLYKQLKTFLYLCILLYRDPYILATL